jgi:hypothetical protein
VIAIVLETATADEAMTERRLRDLGYRKREVWAKEVYAAPAKEEGDLRQLGVGRFVVASCWGRGPG